MNGTSRNNSAKKLLIAFCTFPYYWSSYQWKSSVLLITEIKLWTLRPPLIRPFLRWKRRSPLGNKLGFGLLGFLSDFGVLLKNDRILCCFLDLGVELIVFNFLLYFAESISQLTENKDNAPKWRRGSSILNLERTIFRG